MNEAAERIVRVKITGRVQGVGFRAWTSGRAGELGLAGWVQNRRDGSVEAVFRGPPDAVAEMLEECRDGPPFAKVERVEERAATSAEAGQGGFEQRETVR